MNMVSKLTKNTLFTLHISYSIMNHKCCEHVYITLQGIIFSFFSEKIFLQRLKSVIGWRNIHFFLVNWDWMVTGCKPVTLAFFLYPTTFTSYSPFVAKDTPHQQPGRHEETLGRVAECRDTAQTCTMWQSTCPEIPLQNKQNTIQCRYD